MSKTTLLQYLESNQIISKEDANRVRVERSKSPKSEEAIITELAIVDSPTIALAKSEIFGIPYVDLTSIPVPESVIAEVNVDSLQKFNAVPFERGNDYVKIAMIDPFDIQATQALQQKYPFGTKIQVHITTQESINFILDQRVGDLMSSEVTEALEEVDLPVQDIKDDFNQVLSSEQLRNAPVARIVNSVLQYAVTSGSSDIHIEPMETKLRARFRIHGVMTERLVLPKNLAPAIVSRVKILSNLKIDEKRLPQDGRFQIKVNGMKVDIRVSVMPSIYGEKVVMRLLESDTSGITLEDSGLRGNGYKIFMDSIKSTNGIILVTGPTGSGKTRTLASALMKLNDPKVNIVSLENPVEIRVPGITQVQIQPDINLTFANALRSVLRQDPDIVMVGEIRDQETAELSVQASLTGHLVLSTLHTNSAAAAIPRLLDMGIEPFLLASTMRVVVAQRLPRRICKHCIEAYPAPQEFMDDIMNVFKAVPNFNLESYINQVINAKKQRGETGASVMKAPEVGPQGERVIYLYRGAGCDRCGGSGYSGRIGIFEVLDITEKISRMIMDDVTSRDIENEAVKNGMLTMTQDGYLKSFEGITTIEDVMRVSRE